MRIMMNTVAPWQPSGYGQQAGQILPLMAAEGHQTFCICFQGLSGGPLEWQGVRCLPPLDDLNGNDAILAYSALHRPDLLFTFQNIWTLQLPVLEQCSLQGLRWIPYLPIDHEPAPPRILKRLPLAYDIVCYSSFGWRELARHGFSPRLIPHTVDTEIFRPGERGAFREMLGIPEDAFLFGMVGVNDAPVPRKGFQIVLDAFASFRRRHPDAALYLHTFFSIDRGFRIGDYCRYLGIDDSVYTLDDYTKLFLVDQQTMAAIYASFDWFLIPSANEGFCVPIIEALACGVPVITTDFTAMKDLVSDGETGLKIRPDRFRWSALGSRIADLLPEQIEQAMERAYSSDGPAMGAAGRRFVKAGFDRKLVWQRHWRPYLEELSARLSQEPGGGV
jgi:glycosyltransferase involved in cell wall biosynthesis